MRTLFSHPLFILGLVIRLGLIVVLQPVAANEWYVPFLNNSLTDFTLDPWNAWLAQGGSVVAFPYGYVMWLFFLPLLAVCQWMGLPLLYGYGLTLLIADGGLLLTLRRLLPDRDVLLVAVYWLSPIVLLASYGCGFNDLIPVLLLMLALYCTQRLVLMAAGVLLMAAISAKLSMLLALPFFFIYLWRNRALRQLLLHFIYGLLLGFLLFLLPFMLSTSAMIMLLSNPLMGNIYQFAIVLGHNALIYVVPLMYLLMLYAAWCVRRLNFELFQAMLGVAFLVVVLLTPLVPGWFIWVVPLLVFYQAVAGKTAIMLSALFAVLYVIDSLLLTPDVLWFTGHFGTIIYLMSLLLGQTVKPLVHTAIIAVGIVLAVRIWREMVHRNDYFRLSRKPLVLGIAGDSGAGKDTFADALQGLFGGHSVTVLQGDSYHLWDRQKPMWQVMTHLNPLANDLQGFAHDLMALTDGKNIRCKRYNHATGRMTRPVVVPSNDIIIANGLHALYLPLLRDCYDLSIYLAIDESLRRYFKIQRDVHQRGHKVENVLAALAKREADSVRFIRPQAAHADLVLSLCPIHPDSLNPHHLNNDEKQQTLHLKLVVHSRHGFDEVALTRVLVGVCGLHVDQSTSDDSSTVQLTIEGEPSAADIALAAQLLCPHSLAFLDIDPQWQESVLGLMQLMALSSVEHSLTRRLI